MIFRILKKKKINKVLNYFIKMYKSIGFVIKYLYFSKDVKYLI